MNHSGEIITLQVGNYANFVGAHYFNLQNPSRNSEYGKEFSWKVCWKEGENHRKEKTYTPRTLIFDLKDNVSDGFIRKSSNLSDPPLPGVKASSSSTSSSSNTQSLEKIESSINWDGTVQRIVAPEFNRQEVESRVQAPGVGDDETDYNEWGNFTTWKLNRPEKFAFSVPNFMYNAESDRLAGYGQGLYVYQKLEENVIDGIRLYAEDCDYLEGFHLLVDEYDGFTGIAAGILEHLGDEYDRKACFGFGLNQPIPETTPGVSLKDYKLRMSNTAQLWSAFNRHARVFTSFGVCEDLFVLNPTARKFPSTNQNCSTPYVSSAILAAALDTLSAPYRLKTPAFPLHEITSLLNAFGHKMTLVGSAMPFHLNQQSLFKTLDDQGFSSVISLTPNIGLELDRSIGNLFVARGIKQDEIISKSEFREFKYANINSVTSCMELYCQESYSRSVHVIKDIPPPLKFAVPFPPLYNNSYLDTQSTGNRVDTFRRGGGCSVPALATAHNNPVVETLLEKLVTTTGGGVGGSSMKMKAFYEPSAETCNSVGLEFEDFAESINDLNVLKDAYLKD